MPGPPDSNLKPRGDSLPASFWVLLIGTPLLTLLVTAVAGVLFMGSCARVFIRVLLNRPISDTLAELFVSALSTPPLELLYLSLRSAKGDVIIRPMGSPKPRLGFDAVTLVPAQLARRPASTWEEADLRVQLGPRARRPLHLALPMFVSGMAYGLALSREARLALAEGAKLAGTALNSGQGPFFEEERRRAGAYILQFGRWKWNRSPEVLAAADMIEIQVGQGAMPGNAVLSTPASITDEVRELMHLAPGEPPTIHANLFLGDDPHDIATLAEVVAYLRRETPDIPLAVKMGAGHELEADLDVALDAGVDVIVIDGTEGATGNAPITLSDHFGLPSLVALSRARRHLERQGAVGRVDLVISGGFREPGDVLKAVAMGAKAVGLGTAAMFAIAHEHITAAVPFHPPTDLVFAKTAHQIPINPHAGAKGLANYLESCRREMAIALKAMGHTSLSELSLADLATLSDDIAAWTGIAHAGRAGERPLGMVGACAKEG